MMEKKKARKKTEVQLIESDLDSKPKRRKKTDVLVVEPPSKKASLAETKDKLQTIFGNDADELVGLLESGEDDSTVSQLNKRLIQSCIKLIAQAEKGIHDTNGRYGVHGYVNLVSTIRELVIDLQSSKDRGAMGHTIAENVLRPAFLDLGMNIMTEYATVANDLKELVAPEVYSEFRKLQLASRDRMAAFLQGQYQKMRDETVKFLER